MRAFIVLALVAAASAGLLPNPGYNYGPGQSGAVASGSEQYSSSSFINNAGGNAGSLNAVPGYTYSGGQILTSGSSGSVVSTGVPTVLGLSALDSIPQTVEYSKQFYHFTAPDEERNEGVTRQQLSNVLKKNLQVVFIKAPENNAATNAALQLAKQAIEQRTAIYVLSKENDASQVVGQIQQIQENVPTTPEVRFIRYRTLEDINAAKKTIQSQYDNFGGDSQNFEGGVAPVLNYASKSVSVDFGQDAKFVSGGALSGGVNYPSGVSGSGSLSGAGSVSGGGSLFSSQSGSSVTNVVGGGIRTGSSNPSANYLPSNPLRR